MPGGFSGEQLFFLSFAQSWRTKIREAALRRAVVTDGHAPAEYRADTVRNLDPWYAAFGVKPARSSTSRRPSACACLVRTSAQAPAAEVDQRLVGQDDLPLARMVVSNTSLSPAIMGAYPGWPGSGA